MLLLIALVFSCLTTTPHGADTFLTGSNTFEITDYSIVKNGISNGNRIQSNPFTVGSYQWATEFYPQGLNSSYSDFVSIGVRLLNARKTARAMHTNRLRAWNTSTWSNNTPAYSGINSFLPNQLWGHFNFIKRSNLEASNYLRNDTLVIKTTVWVVKDSSAVLLSPLWTVPNVSESENSNQLVFTAAQDQAGA